jgi:hypothetical protein
LIIVFETLKKFIKINEGIFNPHGSLFNDAYDSFIKRIKFRGKNFLESPDTKLLYQFSPRIKCPRIASFGMEKYLKARVDILIHHSVYLEMLGGIAIPK